MTTETTTVTITASRTTKALPGNVEIISPEKFFDPESFNFFSRNVRTRLLLLLSLSLSLSHTHTHIRIPGIIIIICIVPTLLLSKVKEIAIGLLDDRLHQLEKPKIRGGGAKWKPITAEKNYIKRIMFSPNCPGHVVMGGDSIQEVVGSNPSTRYLYIGHFSHLFVVKFVRKDWK